MGARDLQPADECECGDLLTTVRDFGHRPLKKMYDLRLSPDLNLTERR